MLPSPKIIFSDDQLLAIDKPYGWVVNNAETTAGIETVQDWVEKNTNIFFPDDGGSFGQRRGIVHRLDKETSGILLIAKTPEAFSDLQSQFKSRKVKKKYLVLVHGRLEPREGTIDLPISRSPFNREKFGVFPGGKEASTDYSVVNYFSLDSRGGKDWYSLVEARPKTGRTHQIRVHFKQISHPVFADEKYSGRKTSRQDRKLCSRQFLHAAAIDFFHPKTGEKISLVSELPDDLATALKKFKEEK